MHRPGVRAPGRGAGRRAQGDAGQAPADRHRPGRGGRHGRQAGWGTWAACSSWGGCPSASPCQAGPVPGMFEGEGARDQAAEGPDPSGEEIQLQLRSLRHKELQQLCQSAGINYGGGAPRWQGTSCAPPQLPLRAAASPFPADEHQLVGHEAATAACSHGLVFAESSILAWPCRHQEHPPGAPAGPLQPGGPVPDGRRAGRAPCRPPPLGCAPPVLETHRAPCAGLTQLMSTAAGAAQSRAAAAAAAQPEPMWPEPGATDAEARPLGSSGAPQLVSLAEVAAVCRAALQLTPLSGWPHTPPCSCRTSCAAWACCSPAARRTACGASLTTRRARWAPRGPLRAGMGMCCQLQHAWSAVGLLAWHTPA